MGRSRISDPFLNEARMLRVEDMVRIAVPDLPHDAVPLTYVMERGPARIDGVMKDEFGEVAVFAIAGPDPSDPQLDMIVDARCTWPQWKAWNRNYERLAGFMDPAIFIFTEVAKKYVVSHRDKRLNAAVRLAA